jgi:hypothetical protein
VDRFLVLPLLAPAVLLAAGNDAFGFDPPGWLDSFMYLGYFWHYPEHLWVFDDNSNYKISRLPWILPGYVLHTLTGPIVASYVLAYLSMTVGAVALYLLVRDSLDNRPGAAIVSVAWACCTWAHGIGGWSYQVLVATGYYLMACWLVVRAARAPSPRGAALLAGAFFAAAVHTHLFLVIFAPLVAVLYWAALRTHIENRLSRSMSVATFVIAGGAALTAILAVINRATGGTWLFFMPQIEQALKLTEPSYDHWWRGNAAEWLPSARYLVLPIALLIAGLAVPFTRRGDPERRMSLTLVALGWAALALMCYFQFVRRQTTLDYNYMAFALYPHAFACLGAVLVPSARTAPRAGLIAVLASLVVLAGLLLLLPTRLPDAMNALSVSARLAQAGAIVPPLVVGLLGVAVMIVLRGAMRIAAFVVWFSLVNAWIAPAPSAYGLGTPGYRQSMLTMIHDADRLTTELDPSLIGIKYWMSDEVVATRHGEVRLRDVFDSFLATRAWFTNLLGRKSPSPPIEQLTIEDLDRGACIGVLSSVESQDRLQEQIAAHFAALGRPLRAVTSQRFEGSGLAFAVTVLGPSDRAASGGGHGVCEK